MTWKGSQIGDWIYRVIQKQWNDIKDIPVRNTTLPEMKYGVQYIRAHLVFIWSTPNYFIIQLLGGRLTTCKMAANGEAKA
jgi:hypothetical protein